MKKEQNNLDLLSFISVFDWPVWLSILICVLAVGFLVTLIEKHSPFSSTNTKNELVSKTQIHFSLKESIWLAFGSFLLAGAESPPRTLSTKTLMCGFYIFSAICLSTYQANLAAFLTHKRLESSISSIYDLPSQNKIKYSLVGGSSIQSYFEDMKEIEENFYNFWIKSSLLSKKLKFNCKRSNSTNNLLDIIENKECIDYLSVKQGEDLFGFIDYEALWEYPLGNIYSNLVAEMKKTGYLNHTTEGIQRVLSSSSDDKFAFFIDYPNALYATIKNCDLEIIGSQFSSRPYAMGVKKNSPLKDILSNELLKLQREGILNKLKTKWWYYESSKCVNTDESDIQINLYTVGGIFVFMGGALVIGFAFMIVEYLFRKNSNLVSPVVEN